MVFREESENDGPEAQIALPSNVFFFVFFISAPLLGEKGGRGLAFCSKKFVSVKNNMRFVKTGPLASGPLARRRPAEGAHLGLGTTIFGLLAKNHAE